MTESYRRRQGPTFTYTTATPVDEETKRKECCHYHIIATSSARSWWPFWTQDSAGLYERMGGGHDCAW